MDEHLRNSALPMVDAQPSRPGTDDCHLLFRLAQDEARVNRAELERLYDRGTLLLDQERYEYLGYLSELERACTSLERAALQVLRDSQGIDELRVRIADWIIHAVELRQQARAIVNGEQHRAEGRATRLRSEETKASGSSRRQPALA